MLFFCASKRAAEHINLVDFSCLDDFDVHLFYVRGEQKLLPDFNQHQFTGTIFRFLDSNWRLESKFAVQFLVHLRLLFLRDKMRSHLKIVGRYVVMGNSRNPIRSTLRLVRGLLSSVRTILKDKNLRRFLIALLAAPLDSLHKVYASPDFETFLSLLNSENPDLVVAQTTLNDLSIFGLFEAARVAGVRSLLIIDSWDNLGTKPLLPIGPSKVAVWSKQTAKHALDFHGIPAKKIAILGTPRSRTQAFPSTKPISLPLNLRVAYLEGSSEDLEMNVSCIKYCFNSIKEDRNVPFSKVELVIKPYPFHKKYRQYDVFEFNSDSFMQIRVHEDPSSPIDWFLKDFDLVISETTTAGIQSASWRIPTLFVASNSSKVYLNGERALALPHLSALADLGFTILPTGNPTSAVTMLRRFLQKPAIPNTEFMLGQAVDDYENQLGNCLRSLI